jgi:hypothetical protein
MGGLALGAFATGCTPSIGDKCAQSTDCSIRGDRLCDTSQPGGYCTIFNCGANSCPDDATCVLFHPNVQGCPYDDRSLSRTGRTFCVASCDSDSDCRGGYTCQNPIQYSGAVVLDDNQGKRVCVVIDPRAGTKSEPNASVEVPPVCATNIPDGGVIPLVDSGKGGPSPDAGAPDSGRDAGDAGTDAADASDAGANDAEAGTLDAGTD